MKIGSFYLLKYQLSDLKIHCVLQRRRYFKITKKI